MTDLLYLSLESCENNPKEWERLVSIFIYRPFGPLTSVLLEDYKDKVKAIWMDLSIEERRLRAKFIESVELRMKADGLL